MLLLKMSSLGFSREVTDWYKSYLSSRKFHVNVHRKFSKSVDLRCGAPQGSILEFLLFLLYINVMPQAVDCVLHLYADDTCLLFQHKGLEQTKEELTKNFSNVCYSFLDNKLSIYFGDDKAKSLFFSTKNRKRKIRTFEIQYGVVEIKQYSKVTYLGSELDESLSGEAMTLKVINKISGRFKFLYKKNRYITRLMSNALNRPYFDYACSAWYPTLNKKLKGKLQIIQNKCIRYCLQLDNRSYIATVEFQCFLPRRIMPR